MIYFVYDKDGIVDDYIPYFLKSFKPFCEEICVVVNGLLTDKSKEILEANCDKLLVRENIGFDSGAYKHAIEHYGYEKIKEYDDLILANFTMFGPIFSPQEMFEKMDNSDCDFWGITEFPPVDSYFAGVKINRHVQSYFIDFKKKILNSKDFVEYWKTLKTATNYQEAVAFHELRTTPYYENRGYKSTCYVSPEKYTAKLEHDIKKYDYPYFYYTIQQIKEDRMPFIKRKIFAVKKNCLMWNVEGDATNLLDYIKNNTDYDAELVIENLKRTDLSKVTYLKLYLRFLTLLFCRIFIFWKKDYYKNKIKLIKILYSFIKEIK